MNGSASEPERRERDRRSRGILAGDDRRWFLLGVGAATTLFLIWAAFYGLGYAAGELLQDKPGFLNGIRLRIGVDPTDLVSSAVVGLFVGVTARRTRRAGIAAGAGLAVTTVALVAATYGILFVVRTDPEVGAFLSVGASDAVAAAAMGGVTALSAGGLGAIRPERVRDPGGTADTPVALGLGVGIFASVLVSKLANYYLQSLVRGDPYTDPFSVLSVAVLNLDLGSFPPVFTGSIFALVIVGTAVSRTPLRSSLPGIGIGVTGVVGSLVVAVRFADTGVSSAASLSTYYATETAQMLALAVGLTVAFAKFGPPQVPFPDRPERRDDGQVATESGPGVPHLAVLAAGIVATFVGCIVLTEAVNGALGVSDSKDILDPGYFVADPFGPYAVGLFGPPIGAGVGFVRGLDSGTVASARAAVESAVAGGVGHLVVAATATFVVGGSKEFGVEGSERTIGVVGTLLETTPAAVGTAVMAGGIALVVAVARSRTIAESHRHRDV